MQRFALADFFSLFLSWVVTEEGKEAVREGGRGCGRICYVRHAQIRLCRSKEMNFVTEESMTIARCGKRYENCGQKRPQDIVPPPSLSPPIRSIRLLSQALQLCFSPWCLPAEKKIKRWRDATCAQRGSKYPDWENCPLSRYVLGAATVAKEGGGKRIRKKVVDGGSQR